MIWLAPFDSVGAVKLLEEDYEGQFMLHRHIGERPCLIALATKFRGVSTCTSD